MGSDQQVICSDDLSFFSRIARSSLNFNGSLIISQRDGRNTTYIAVF
jgi:hypothetical protein